MAGNSNTVRIGRSAPMPQHKYEGPLPDQNGLVYFHVQRSGEKAAKIGVKPSALKRRMQHWQETGHRVWLVR